MAHRATPPFAPLHIVSDSKYVVDGLTRWLEKWEEEGWIGTANRRQMMEAAALLRSRSAPTTFQWVKGHSRVRGNEEADRLAGEGANLPAPYAPAHPPPPTHFLRQGASLACMTQRLAYKGIRQRHAHEMHRKTTQHVDLAIEAVRATTGKQNVPRTWWKAIRRDPIERGVRDFLWKVAHNAYKVGPFWKNIPNCEARAQCSICGVEDSMTHILTECEAPGQGQMWDMAKALLERRKVCLPANASFGMYLGAPMMEIEDDNGKARPGTSRLTKIILSETAHAIWKARCERVIGWEGQNKTHDEGTIRRMWQAAIARRSELDQQMTKTALAGRRTMDEEVVRRTWEGVWGDARGENARVGGGFSG
ncbi:ribonuclease H-like protein [Cubamyces lactineus]|nr:ribonuclease H-like protein [Cubamyces lactineus]